MAVHHTGSVIDQDPALYREAFSSRWTDAAPWLWRFAAAFFVAAIIAYYVMYFSDEYTKGSSDVLFSALGVVAILLIPLAMNANVKRRGEVVVTKKGLTVAEEGSEWFFAKADIRSVAVQTLYRGRYRDDVFVFDKPPARFAALAHYFSMPAGSERASVRPYHFRSSRSAVQGVVVRTTDGDLSRRPADSSMRPLFIPSQDPEGLAAALRSIQATK